MRELPNQGCLFNGRWDTPETADLLSTAACTPPWRGIYAALVTVPNFVFRLNGSIFRKVANQCHKNCAVSVQFVAYWPSLFPTSNCLFRGSFESPRQISVLGIQHDLAEHPAVLEIFVRGPNLFEGENAIHDGFQTSCKDVSEYLMQFRHRAHVGAEQRELA